MGHREASGHRKQQGGIRPAQYRSQRTVRQLIERSIAEYHGPKIRKLKQNQNQRRTDLAQRIAPYGLADLHAEKVRAGDIERWRDALRKDSYAHSTINATLTRLSMIFAWAIRQEIITVATLRRSEPATDKAAPRLLHARRSTPATALPDVLPMIPMVLLHRDAPGSCSAAVEDIDFQAERIHVRRSFDGPTKTDQTRVIPLHRELAPILRAWREQCPKTPKASSSAGGLRSGPHGNPEALTITTTELRAQLARAGVRNDFALSGACDAPHLRLFVHGSSGLPKR